MPRPRRITDDAVLDAALDVMMKHGPAGATFARLADATGLATATLVQRFGSKPALVQAALLRGWDLLDARTAAADHAAPPTVAGAVMLLVELSSEYATGDAYADGLLLLREDFRDPDLRKRGDRWGGYLADALGRRLGGAAGPRPDLGRLMASQWQGALLWWGFAPDRPLDEAVAESLRGWCAAISQPLPD